MIKNILFVCKHNVFRSRYAEAYFKKLNKNSSIKAKSAGIIKRNHLDKNQVNIAKKRGIKLKGIPIKINKKLLNSQDIIVIVADDVPPEIFKGHKKHGKRLIIWKIPDNTDGNKKEIEKIMILIEKRVKSLIGSLK